MTRLSASTWLLVGCIALGAAPTPLASQDRPTVRAVTFPGRQAIGANALLDTIGIRPGDLWPEDGSEKIVDRLRLAPSVSVVGPVEISVENDLVDIRVPIREQLAVAKIEFRGNDAIPTRRLRDVCRLQRGQLYSSMLRDAARQTVLEHYHSDGFLLASVAVRTRTRGAGAVDVIFDIRERYRVHLRSVTLEGTTPARAIDALRAVRLQPRRFFGLVERGYYQPELLPKTLAALEGFFVADGFLNATVDLTDLTFHRNYHEVSLRLRVREGERWKVGAIRVEGHELFPTQRLQEVIDVPTGGFYSEKAAGDGARRLLEWYQTHADRVPTIQVRQGDLTREGPSEENTLSVIYEVDERTHVVTREVSVSGNTKTRDRVVRREISLAPGEPFTLIELKRSLERLRKRGHFRTVEATSKEEPTQDPDVEHTDVNFHVTEQPNRGLLQAGGGASSGEGELAYFAIHQPNFDLLRLPAAWNDWDAAFVGGGQRLDLELIPGNKESEYRLRFVEPYFFRSDLRLSLSAGTARFRRRSYDEDHVRAQIGLRKYFDREHRVSASLDYLFDQVRISDFDADAPAAAQAVEGYTSIAYPRFELRFEELDFNYFSGPEGYRVLAQADYADAATGSESDFLRLLARADLFWSFSDENPDYRHVLHATVEAGRIRSLDGDGTHIAERYFLGGPRSFRGFTYRGLGPHVGRTPVGGNGMIRGSLEYSFPLFWRELRGTALFDWGELAPSFSRLSTGRFRTAVGGGLRTRLHLLGQPLPANFYWVEALGREPEDRERLFLFSLGYAF